MLTRVTEYPKFFYRKNLLMLAHLCRPRPCRFCSFLVRIRRIVRLLAGEVIPSEALPDDLRQG